MKPRVAAARRYRLRASLMSLAAMSVVSGGAARANGRFPRAERLVEDARDPNHLILAATYGLVRTGNRGQNWYHICEAAFTGLDSYVGDPLVDLTDDGSLLVDVQTSLNLSHDDGCSWSTAFGGPAESVPDFTVARHAPRSVLALRLLLEDGGVAVHVSESTDNGATFATLGSPLGVFTAFSIEVAPSDSRIIYVSARSAAGVGQLLVSTDHGATFASNDLPSTAFDEIPYIAAVHPADPNKVFVRTDAWAVQDGMYLANDALLYTEDRGKTWRELYRTGAKLLGFALSPDASTVLLGYGNPRDSGRQIDDSVTGVYRGATAAFAFSRIMAGSITCLSWTSTGVFVCTSQAEKGYALGFSPDSNFGAGGPDLQPLLDLRAIAGPPCCGGTAQAVCAASWPSSCALFGACGDAGEAALVACSDDGGNEGSVVGAGEGVDAGRGARGGGEGTGHGGCGCRLHGGGRSSRGGQAASLAALAVVLLARARRPSSASLRLSFLD